MTTTISTGFLFQRLRILSTVWILSLLHIFTGNPIPLESTQRRLKLGKQIQVFPPTRPPPALSPKTNIKQRAEQGVCFLVKYVGFKFYKFFLGKLSEDLSTWYWNTRRTHSGSTNRGYYVVPRASELWPLLRRYYRHIHVTKKQKHSLCDISYRWNESRSK